MRLAWGESARGSGDSPNPMERQSDLLVHAFITCHASREKHVHETQGLISTLSLAPPSVGAQSESRKATDSSAKSSKAKTIDNKFSALHMDDDNDE